MNFSNEFAAVIISASAIVGLLVGVAIVLFKEGYNMQNLNQFEIVEQSE